MDKSHLSRFILEIGKIYWEFIRFSRNFLKFSGIFYEYSQIYSNQYLIFPIFLKILKK